LVSSPPTRAGCGLSIADDVGEDVASHEPAVLKHDADLLADRSYV
jgi:hypothetical protein